MKCQIRTGSGRAIFRGDVSESQVKLLKMKTVTQVSK